MDSIQDQLILYGTEGCHLCDEARDLLDLVLSVHNKPIDYPYIDIVDNDELMQQYGTSIPVIKAIHSNKELNWPFGSRDLVKLLKL